MRPPPDAVGAGSRVGGTVRETDTAGRVAAGLLIPGLCGTGTAAAAGVFTAGRGRAPAGGGAIAAAAIENGRLQLKQMTGVPPGIA